jgi:hypothetical protein
MSEVFVYYPLPQQAGQTVRPMTQGLASENGAILVNHGEAREGQLEPEEGSCHTGN